MSDLVQRLRHDRDCLHTVLCEEAANRIEALETAHLKAADVLIRSCYARIEALEASLREIASLDTPKSPTAQQVADVLENASNIARCALEGENMSDLVQRLRAYQWHFHEIGDDTTERSAAPWEAADRIETLEAALRKIRCERPAYCAYQMMPMPTGGEWFLSCCIARRALEGNP